MKSVRHIAGLLVVAFVAITLIGSPSTAIASETDSNSVDQILVDLMNENKEDFLQIAADVCNRGESSALYAVAAAFCQRPDISLEDKIEYAINKENSDFLRHIALESYVQTRPATIDERILNLMADNQEDPRLRSYAIATLATSMDESMTELLVDTAENSDSGLSFNSLKALEKVNPSCALLISESIYENYEEETPARINIAAKVLSRYFEKETSRSKNTISPIQMTKQEYIEQSELIFNSMDNSEIKHVISDTVATVTEDSTVLNTISPRASSRQGYAAYRDGVMATFDDGLWHTAIIYSGTGQSNYVMAQASGLNKTTEFVNYSTFLNGENPKGYYRPASSSLTSSQRSDVYITAGDIAAEHIEYQLSSQIDYSHIYNTGGQYTVNDIVAIRCDGLVEFAYEYNGIRVYGDDDCWDISEKRLACYDEHSLSRIYPQKQAEDYMVRLGSL